MAKKINTTLNTIYNELSKSEELFRLIFIMEKDCLDKAKYSPKRVQDGWFYAEGNKSTIIDTRTLYRKVPIVNFAENIISSGIVGFFYGGQRRLENNMDNFATVIDVGFVIPVEHEVMSDGASRILLITDKIIEIVQKVQHNNGNLLFLSSELTANRDMAGIQFLFSALSTEDDA